MSREDSKEETRHLFDHNSCPWNLGPTGLGRLTSHAHRLFILFGTIDNDFAPQRKFAKKFSVEFNLPAQFAQQDSVILILSL
jgi:hypothetical protein